MSININDDDGNDYDNDENDDENFETRCLLSWAHEICIFVYLTSQILILHSPWWMWYYYLGC